MPKPHTPDELKALAALCSRDPQQYVRLTTEWIAEDPANSNAYVDRHFAWLELGQIERALEDLNKSIQLQPNMFNLTARGEIYRIAGEIEEALSDFLQAEALDPTNWHTYRLLYQADCHARLGDEAAALACCSHLPDDFWTPGYLDEPPGSKAEIVSQLRATAEAAKLKRGR